MLSFLKELLGIKEHKLTCFICGEFIEQDDEWSWCSLENEPIHDRCIPAWLRSAGTEYVDFWLETGDTMRVV